MIISIAYTKDNGRTYNVDTYDVPSDWLDDVRDRWIGNQTDHKVTDLKP